jgi:hypothetical protein
MYATGTPLRPRMHCRPGGAPVNGLAAAAHGRAGLSGRGQGCLRSTLSGVVIEIMRFRLPPGADEAAFVEADRRVQQEFAYQQPGLLRRTTARGADGAWIVIDLWRSAGDADACDARWDHDRVVQEFMALLDGPSVTVERYLSLG